jgi:hypothetical protein
MNNMIMSAVLTAVLNEQHDNECSFDCINEQHDNECSFDCINEQHDNECSFDCIMNNMIMSAVLTA